MAKQDIVIGIKTQFEGDMGKTLDTLDSKVKDVTKSIDKLGDTEEKAGKQSKDASKSFKNTANEIRKGIVQSNLYVEGLKMLKDAFMSNQVVADALNGVMNAINIIFQQVIGTIIEVVKQTAESTNGFEGLFAVMKGGITISLTPLKAAFYAVKLAIAEVQLLWEKSPFGSGDTKTIQDLEKTISETADSLLQVGKDAIDSYGNIANNIGKAVDEVSQVVTKSVEGISKINVAGALEQGKALVALEKNAKIAEAQAAKSAAKYERQAELLRQIRDDDTKSLAERIEANDALAGVLDKQEQALLRSAKAQLAAATAKAKATGKIEDETAKIQAQANLQQVQADIEGKRSEQKQNEVNLRKESLALSQAEIDKNTEVALKQQQNTTARIKDEEQRLIQQRIDLETEKGIELQRLQDKINSAQKGTQARVDAEKEYALKKVEIDNQIAQTDDQINEVRFNKTKSRLDKELQATIDSEKEKADELVAGSSARLEAERMILQSQLEFYTQHKAELFKTDEEYAAKKLEIDKLITQNEKAEQEVRRQNAIQTAQEVLGSISGLMGNISTLRDNENKAEIRRLTDENNAVLQNEADKVNATQVGTEARKRAELNYSKIKENLDKKLAEEKKKIDKDAFERGKKIGIATALINGAQAVISALATPDPTLGVISGIRVAAAVATTAIQVAAIRAQTFEGGSESPTISGGGAPTTPTLTAPSTIGLGDAVITRTPQKEFQRVYVVESDIRQTTNRVEVLENRSVLGG